MHRHTLSSKRMSALADDLPNLRIERICEANMAHHALLKEGKWSNTLGSVDDLVWDHKVSRSDLLLQTSYSTECNHGSNTNAPQSCDVGAVGNLMWCVFVVCAMAGEEGDGGVVVLEDVDGRGGVAPRCERIDCCNGDEAVKFLKASSTDHGDVDGAC